MSMKSRSRAEEKKRTRRLGRHLLYYNTVKLLSSPRAGCTSDIRYGLVGPDQKCTIIKQVGPTGLSTGFRTLNTDNNPRRPYIFSMYLHFTSTRTMSELIKRGTQGMGVWPSLSLGVTYLVRVVARHCLPRDQRLWRALLHSWSQTTVSPYSLRFYRASNELASSPSQHSC